MVRLKHLLDAAVEPLDHAVGLGVLRWGEAVFDAKVAAQQIEVVLAGGRALAQAEPPIGELLEVIGQHRSDVDRASFFPVALKPAGIRGGSGFVDADEDPCGRPVDGSE